MNAQETYLIEDESLIKPEVQLVGMDGNAFSIIGRITKVWKRLGRPDIAEEFQQRAMSGDYNNLLAITMEYINEDAAWGEDEDEEGSELIEAEEYNTEFPDGEHESEDEEEYSPYEDEEGEVYGE